MLTITINASSAHAYEIVCARVWVKIVDDDSIGELQVSRLSVNFHLIPLFQL